MRKTTVSLARQLRARYSSPDAERAALDAWRQQTPVYQARELGRFALIGIPRRSLMLGSFCFAVLIHAFLPSPLFLAYWWAEVSFLAAVIVWVGGGASLPQIVRYLEYPHARRAALWLAWLGNKDALPHLLRAWRRSPRTPGQRRWIAEVEVALTDLIDVLPPARDMGNAEDCLRDLLQRCYPQRTPKNPPDFTTTRAYLLIGALRYVYGGLGRGDVPQLLTHIAALPADSTRAPNRCLVRDVARLYEARITGRILPSAAPLPLAVVPPAPGVLVLLQRH